MHFDVLDLLEVLGKCFFGNWSSDNLKYSEILVASLKHLQYKPLSFDCNTNHDIPDHV